MSGVSTQGAVMRHLVLFILAADKALRIREELRVTKFDVHGLYYDGKLLKCARMAGRLGFLHWE